MGRYAHDCALIRDGDRRVVMAIMTDGAGGFEAVSRTGAALYAALGERPGHSDRGARAPAGPRALISLSPASTPSPGSSDAVSRSPSTLMPVNGSSANSSAPSRSTWSARPASCSAGGDAQARLDHAPEEHAQAARRAGGDEGEGAGDAARLGELDDDAVVELGHGVQLVDGEHGLVGEERYGRALA